MTIFSGRLHFCIHYPDLDFESRKSIWKMFFKKAMSVASDADIDRFAGLRLNGRQVGRYFVAILQFGS